MAHFLRVYKHGASGYTEVTNEMAGGFENLELVDVRNDAGSLSFGLSATTPAMFHEWLDEAATVELWDEAVRLGIYQVDDYTPKWSALTCTVNCPGLLVATKGTPFTATYTSGTGTEILSGMVAACPEIGWDAGKITGASGVVDQLVYADKPVFDCMTELSQLLGFDFRVDGDGDLCTAPWPTEVDKTFTLNVDAFEFDTKYSASDIVNRLVLATDSGVWTFDELDSQALYGIRQEKVSVTGIVTEAVAHDWAQGVFLSLAWPIQRITVETTHGAGLPNVPGMLVEVVGLEDDRTYRDVISQVTWTVADLTDQVNVGHQPPALQPPQSLAKNGTDGKNGTDAPARDAVTLSATAMTLDISVSVMSTDGLEDTASVPVTLQKWTLFGEGAGAHWEWYQAGASGTSPPSTEVIFAITPPAIGTELYRALYRGDARHSPCFSNVVEASVEGLSVTTGLENLPGYTDGAYLASDGNGGVEWHTGVPGGVDVSGYAILSTVDSYDSGTNQALISHGGESGWIAEHMDNYTPVSGDEVWTIGADGGTSQFSLILGKRIPITEGGGGM